jgi:hypothetical protein
MEPQITSIHPLADFPWCGSINILLRNGIINCLYLYLSKVHKSTICYGKSRGFNIEIAGAVPEKRTGEPDPDDLTTIATGTAENIISFLLQQKDRKEKFLL